jgi:nucleotide-binding universal stress UspA family protein
MIETTTPRTALLASPAGRAWDTASTPRGIRHILFPSDLSPASDLALGHARFLAVRFGARLTLYHAVEASPSHQDGPSEPADEAWRRAADRVRGHLDCMAGRLPTEIEIVVERGASAHQALVAHTLRTRPDLTVMATHGREGLAHLLAGSVTETVLRRGPCPVLCVREPEHGVALPYRRILVPTDLSQASRRAFPMAALLARSFESEVLALHAAQVEAPPSLIGVSQAVEGSPSEAEVARFLEHEFRDVRLTPRVLLGAAWTAIVETARAERVDLIVMSTHGHDSLSDRLIGSHAERVVRHAPCPVLIV